MWRPDHTVQNPSHFSSSSPSFSDPIGGAAAGGSLVGAPPSPATGMAVLWSRGPEPDLSFSPISHQPDRVERQPPLRLAGGGDCATAGLFTGACARPRVSVPPSNGLGAVP